VRFMMFAKIALWFSSRNVQNAMANTNPKYLARSPVSMRSATKFIAAAPRMSLVPIVELDDVHHRIAPKK
jgi:hypothetical protein